VSGFNKTAVRPRRTLIRANESRPRQGLYMTFMSHRIIIFASSLAVRFGVSSCAHCALKFDVFISKTSFVGSVDLGALLFRCLLRSLFMIFFLCFSSIKIKGKISGFRWPKRQFHGILHFSRLLSLAPSSDIVVVVTVSQVIASLVQPRGERN
jgi:hypothetical protein